MGKNDDKDADSLMKRAEKKLVPSMKEMRLKPDWEEACPLFEKAALQYKLDGKTKQAIVAYEKAAEANTRGGGTLWHAAKHLEDAALLSVGMENWNAAEEFYKLASSSYVEAGKVSNGAECLGRGASKIQQHAPLKAAELYRTALDLYTEDRKAGMAEDMVQKAVGMLLMSNQAAAAAEFLIKWGSICDEHNMTVLLCRAYLSAIVVLLHMGDAAGAWQTYQDMLDVSAFSESSEGMAAEDLFVGFASGEGETIRAKVSMYSDFKSVHAHVARLAKQLPSPSCNLATMSSLLCQRMDIAPPPVDADGFLAESDEDGELDLT